MAVKTSVTEAEYLRTSFPGVDQELRDGELVERTMPDTQHARVQANVCAFFAVLRKAERLPLYALPELRRRIRPDRFMIPDVAICFPAIPDERVPEQPPLIVMEILSQDDRMSEVLDQLEEYVEWGAPHVWLVDAAKRRLYSYDRLGLHAVSEYEIPEGGGRKLTAADLFE